MKASFHSMLGCPLLSDAQAGWPVKDDAAIIYIIERPCAAVFCLAQLTSQLNSSMWQPDESVGLVVMTSLGAANLFMGCSLASCKPFNRREGINRLFYAAGEENL